MRATCKMPHRNSMCSTLIELRCEVKYTFSMLFNMIFLTSETWACTFKVFSISSEWSRTYCMCCFITGLQWKGSVLSTENEDAEWYNILCKCLQYLWRHTHIPYLSFSQELYQLYHLHISSWSRLSAFREKPPRHSLERIPSQLCNSLQ